jgi:hypothetical protein
MFSHRDRLHNKTLWFAALPKETFSMRVYESCIMHVVLCTESFLRAEFDPIKKNIFQVMYLFKTILRRYDT